MVKGRLQLYDGVCLEAKEVDGRTVYLVRVHVYAWLAEDAVRSLGPFEALGGALYVRDSLMPSDVRSMAEVEAGRQAETDGGIGVEVRELRAARGVARPWQKKPRRVRAVG